MVEQGDAFRQGEGDGWFKRNLEGFQIFPSRVKFCDWAIESGVKSDTYLEIGAGNGIPAAYTASRFQAKAYGIEPSAMSVNTWEERSQHTEGGDRLQMLQGSAKELPFEDSSFDIVVFGFCLYLVDRKELLRSLSEADRVLKDKGILVIDDFEPPSQYSNEYSHYEGLYSFKANYSHMFENTGIYRHLQKFQYQLGADSLSNFGDYNKLCALNILQKDLELPLKFSLR